MFFLKNLTIPIILVIILFVVGDKLTTAIAINVLSKNPNHSKDPLVGEKNPIARWFMKHLGIIGGNIAFAFVHFIMIILFVLPALTWAFSQLKFSMNNPYGIALYTLCLMHGLVISNNIYFILKFGGHI